MKIEWVHFPLHPETPPEGQSLEDLPPRRVGQGVKDLISGSGLNHSGAIQVLG